MQNPTAAPHKPMVVLKFGGTSVARAERWEGIAKILRERISSGQRPLVVCSALSQVSNRLEAALESALAGGDPMPEVDAVAATHRELTDALGLALPEEAEQELAELRERLIGVSMTRDASPRLQARIMAAGELASTRIGAAWLSGQGLPTRWLDACELVTADSAPESDPLQYLSATCSHDRDPALARRLAGYSEPVLLTQGFLARGPDGDVALLGRGGSDTSATVLAARLGAEHVEIWTDVPGLFSADPRVVPGALKLARVGYEEASELTTRGAKVLHPRSLAPAREARIPIHVCNTSAPAEAGTVIDGSAGDEPAALAISSRTGMTVIAMDVEGTWQRVGVIADLTACFARQGISIDSIASSQTRVTVSLDPAALPLGEPVVEALLEELEPHCRPARIHPVASISVIGTHLRCVLHHLPSLFRMLEEHEVHLISHAAHDHSLTFVVDEAAADGIVRRLHDDLVRVRQGAAEREGLEATG